MSMYIHICMYIRIYITTYIHICMYVYIYIYIYTMYVYICKYICICIYTYVYIYICVCTYIYIWLLLRISPTLLMSQSRFEVAFRFFPRNAGDCPVSTRPSPGGFGWGCGLAMGHGSWLQICGKTTRKPIGLMVNI